MWVLGMKHLRSRVKRREVRILVFEETTKVSALKFETVSEGLLGRPVRSWLVFRRGE